MGPEGFTPPGITEEAAQQFGTHFTLHVEGLNKPELDKYVELANDLGGSVKIDIRWNREESGNPQYLQNYREALAACAKYPEQKPIIILDSPPDWANKEIKDNPEKVFGDYKRYCQHVKELLNEAGVKPSVLQVMNEINNPLYNKFDLEQIAKLCTITKEIFVKNGESDAPLVMLTILPEVSPLKTGRIRAIPELFAKLGEIKDTDVIGIDWYQGTYPSMGYHNKGTKSVFLGSKPTETFGNVATLKEHFDQFLPGGPLAQKMAMISEVGFPTPLGEKHERMQRLFYNQFIKGLHGLLMRYEEKQEEVPLIGLSFYSLKNEPERPGSEFHTIFAPVERLINKYLESKWGILGEEGEPKGAVAKTQKEAPVGDVTKGREETLVERIRYLTQNRLLARIKTVEKQKEELSSEK